MARHPNIVRKQARQREFVGMLAEGHTIADACRSMGFARQTYERWRRDDPAFRRLIDGMRGTLPPPERYDGSFRDFRRRFLGMESYEVHMRIIHELESMKGGEFICILVPPEFGKTTLFEDWITKKIVEDQNIRITYGSEGQPHARKALGRVKRRLSDQNVAPELLANFGPFHVDGQERQGKPWGADYFTAWGADHDERDYTFEARGIRSSISGTRSDALAIDDAQSVKSLNLTPQFVHALRQDWFTRPGQDSWLGWLGTRVGIGDVHETLIDDGVFDKVIIIPALDAKGESTCPEMWPTEALLRKREKVGEEVWHRTYMQAPRSSFETGFTEEVIDACADLTRSYWQMPAIYSPGDVSLKVTSLDPALTGGNAILSAAFTRDRFDILAAETHYNIARYEAILTRLDEHCRMVRPDILVIEDNAFQKGFAHDDRLKEMAGVYGFRVERHTTGHNKLDEALGVARMASSFVSKEISWPSASDQDRQRMDAWRHQLLTWRPDANPRKHKMDIPMAMWFAWLIWQRHKNRIEAGSTSTITTRALPWAPTGFRPLSGVR